jgi:hypothetical protein
VALSYQWYRGAAVIPGANAATYAVQAADVGARLKVAVAGTSPGYETVIRTSGGTEAVITGTLSAGKPVVSGTRKVGRTLTAKPGTWSPSGVILTYKWYRGSAAIAGADKVTYKLVKADKGRKVTVRVRGTAAGYTTLEKVSSPTRIG